MMTRMVSSLPWRRGGVCGGMAPAHLRLGSCLHSARFLSASSKRTPITITTTTRWPTGWRRCLSQSTESDIERCKQRFDDCFQAEKIYDIYWQWEKIDTAHLLTIKVGKQFFVIDDAEETLSSPLLGFDACAGAKTVIDSFDLKGRKKPLIATVRGVGGGKTRALEEVRRELMNKGDILALPVTFNNITTLVAGEVRKISHLPKYEEERDWLLAKAIVMRMAFMLYVAKTDFECFRNKYSDNLDAMMQEFSSCTQLLQGFVLHAVGQVNKNRSEQSKVTKFVLLIDEFACVVEALDKTKTEWYDPSSSLRSALLAPPPSGMEVKTALVISSLETAPLGKTDSERPIKILKLPERLDAKEIVERWWGVQPNAPEYHLLELLANVFCELPRANEVLKICLSSQTDSDKGGGGGGAKALGDNNASVRAKALRTLWEGLRIALNDKYPGLKGFESEHLFKAIFFVKVSCDDSWVRDAIIKSRFVNVVDPTDPYFFPRTSLGSVIIGEDPSSNAIEIGSSTGSHTAAKPLAFDIQSILNQGSAIEMIRKALPQLIMYHSTKVALVMEELFMFWLMVKLKSMKENREHNLRLKNVFPFPIARGESWIATDVGQSLGYRMLKKLVRNQTAFLAELRQINITDGPCVIKPHPKDCFDCAMLVRLKEEPGKCEPFLLLFDCKSQDEIPGSATTSAPELSRKSNDSTVPQSYSYMDKYAANKARYRQYVNVEKLFAYATAQENNTEVPKGSALEAFLQGRWAYLYIDSHARSGEYGTSSVIELEGEDKKRGYVILRPETEKFFGPLWPLVRTLRGLQQKPPGALPPVGGSVSEEAV